MRLIDWQWIVRGMILVLGLGVGVPHTVANTPMVFDPIEPERGFQKDRAYTLGSDIDTIDTASGALMLQVPLGQVYEVGPVLKYQFRAVYNSNIWDHFQLFNLCDNSPLNCEHGVPRFALTNPGANAGIGWEVHLGRLFAPLPPPQIHPDDHEYQRWPNRGFDTVDRGSGGPQRWMYVAPDGEVHYLHGLPGRDNGSPSLPKRYSKDGSYLRLRKLDGNRVVVERPDGVISQFERTSEKAGTLFCGDGRTDCWRLQFMRDRWGNQVDVDYLVSGYNETWVVSDSTGRSHALRFSLDPNKLAGGDAPAGTVYYTPGQNEWGDLRRILERVEVAAFGGAQAAYVFHYQTRTMARGCPHDGPRFDPAGLTRTLTTKALTRIAVPGAGDFYFSTLGDPGPHCSPTSGRIERVTLPAGGQFEYDWAPWEIPAACDFFAVGTPPSFEFFHHQAGVSQRRLIKAGGGVEARYYYSSELVPRTGLVPSGSGCTRSRYRKTTVTGPATGGKHTKSVTYHSTYVGTAAPNGNAPISGWQVTDGGLPYTKDFSIGSGNGDKRFLSKEIFECDSSGCEKMRSTYVRYAMEYRSCSRVFGDSAGCFSINPYKSVERTVFHKDGGKYIEREYRLPDGAGNTEVELVKDNFDLSERLVRTTTDYTATGATRLRVAGRTGYVDVLTPDDYLPDEWILHPYRQTWQRDSSKTYVAEYEFSPEGALTCVRRWKGGARSGQDLVTRYDLGTAVGVDAGLPTREVIAGGDTANLNGAEVCALGTGINGSRYAVHNEYADLQLERSYIDGYPNHYRADIDQNTGLPQGTYDPTDQRTGLSYDLLGRLTAITPAASLQQASTEIRHYETGPWVRVRKLWNGQELDYRGTVFDGFGRVWREIVRRPTAIIANHFAESERRTSYHPSGFVYRQTTWQAVGGLDWNHSVQSTDYDPFGRPRKVRSPDGTEETRSYFGERAIQSTVDVGTGFGTTTGVTTTQIRDGIGRTVRIATPIHTTYLTYDPASQVVESSRVGGGLNQIRQYSWDGRGFMTGEFHPEVGTDPNTGGWVSYKLDAFNNPTEHNDGLHNRTYTYDGAGRALSMSSDGDLLYEWEYAAANAGTNYQKGKLIRAVRHNHLVEILQDWVLEEEYEYRGALGKPSRRTTQLQIHFPNGTVDHDVTFDQSWQFNALGRVVSTAYPHCIFTPETSRRLCNDGDDRVAVPNLVTNTYFYDRLTRVRSSRFFSANHRYHPNLMLSHVNFSNGVQGLFEQDPEGMPRPRRMRYTFGSSTLWDSGEFHYDGAGNITEIGADDYLYDVGGRLVLGTVRHAGPSFRAEYTYDAMDNLRGFRRNNGIFRGYEVNGRKNHHLGEAGNWITRYDAAGNWTGLDTLPSGNPTQDLEYDGENRQRLVRFYQGGSETVVHRYVYGPDGRRWLTFRTDSPVRQIVFRDLDGKPLRAYEVTGFGTDQQWNWSRDLVNGPTGLVARIDHAGAKSFFQPDHLGTPRLITDNSGAVTGRHNYYPFGQEIFAPGQDDEITSKFTGHERDPHGLTDNMMARTYAFPFHRFMSADPARDGWNLYAYVGNSPINFRDPTGRLRIRASRVRDWDHDQSDFDSLLGDDPPPRRTLYRIIPEGGRSLASKLKRLPAFRALKRALKLDDVVDRAMDLTVGEDQQIDFGSVPGLPEDFDTSEFESVLEDRLKESLEPGDVEIGGLLNENGIGKLRGAVRGAAKEFDVSYEGTYNLLIRLNNGLDRARESAEERDFFTGN